MFEKALLGLADAATNVNGKDRFVKLQHHIGIGPVEYAFQHHRLGFGNLRKILATGVAGGGVIQPFDMADVNGELFTLLVLIEQAQPLPLNGQLNAHVHLGAFL